VPLYRLAAQQPGSRACEWKAELSLLILLKNPLFLEISHTASEMLEKLSLQNALRSIFQEWVDRFSGVFDCSFLISWGFSAESLLRTDPFTVK
jgi:hypothetical protein